MNAYELADWIDEVNKPIVGSKTMKEASAMLRQQADRIAELENVSSKPVAWMHKNPDYAISKHQSLEFNIPLYTHPVKQLSDKDISRIYHSENRISPQGNFAYYGFARAIIKEITE